jgi:glycosyltransferase involved in cell wall biosynthesis
MPACGGPNLAVAASDDVKTILLNATTINIGGGIQAAVSIIRQIIDEFQNTDGARWIFSVSGEVRDELAGFGYVLRDGIDLCLEQSPAKNRRSRITMRKFANTQADLVFTFFGPAYVAFDVPHLCGVADGWVTHSDRLAYATLPTWAEKLRKALTCAYKGLWFRRADYWIVEQEVARAGLARRLRLPADHIYVISNNCGQAYIDASPAPRVKSLQSTIRILTFATDVPNKCLELIPQIAALLVRQYHIDNVQFVVTVPVPEYAETRIAKLAVALGVERYICNVGYVALKDGPSLYRSCDIALMPSVLETFSATYPESMRMGLPIVTSDLEFARTICLEAAMYFKPRDAAGAAAKLAALIGDSELRAKMAAAGFSRAAEFPSPMEKCRQYRKVIDSMVQRTPDRQDSY